MDIVSSGRVHAQLLTEGFSLPDELLELECAYIEPVVWSRVLRGPSELGARRCTRR